MTSVNLTINATSVGDLQHQLRQLLSGTALQTVTPAAPRVEAPTTPAAPAAEAPTAEIAKEPAKRGRGAAKAKPESEAPAAAAEENEAAPEDAGKLEDMTVPELRASVASVLTQISSEGGEPVLLKAKEIFVKYGVKKQSEIKVEDLPAVIEELKTLLKA